jgi:hypothetical protein
MLQTLLGERAGSKTLQSVAAVLPDSIVIEIF